MRFDFSRDQVAGHNAPRFAVHDDEIQHLRSWMHLDRSLPNLSGENGISAQEKLLSGLASGIKSPGDLGPAERTVVEITAVFAGEGNALRHALINDIDTYLGEAINVGLAGTEVAAFDGVVE